MDKVKIGIRRFLRVLQKTVETILSIVYIVLFTKLRGREPVLRGGQDVIVLGNGPSLNLDLKDIVNFSSTRNVNCWCVNNFVASEYYKILKPSNYVIADPEYWLEEFSDESACLKKEFFEKINSLSSWPVTLHVPYDARKADFTKNIQSPWIKVKYYNRTPVRGITYFRHICYNWQLGIPVPYNVLIATLSMAIRTGPKNIWLAGADHSWHEELNVDTNNRTTINQEHFYDSDKRTISVDRDPNTQFRIGDLLIRFGKIFQEYDVVKEYASYRGVCIFNISSKSYIDSFERKSIMER